MTINIIRQHKSKLGFWSASETYKKNFPILEKLPEFFELIGNGMIFDDFNQNCLWFRFMWEGFQLVSHYTISEDWNMRKG